MTSLLDTTLHTRNLIFFDNYENIQTDLSNSHTTNVFFLSLLISRRLFFASWKYNPIIITQNTCHNPTKRRRLFHINERFQLQQKMYSVASISNRFFWGFYKFSQSERSSKNSILWLVYQFLQEHSNWTSNILAKNDTTNQRMEFFELLSDWLNF